MNWMLVGTLGSMLAFWVTALVILFQIRSMRAARNVEVTMRMFEWSESNQMREAVRWVTAKFDLATYLAQDESARSDYPGLLVAFYEQAGVMIQKRFVNEDVMLDNLGLDVMRVWDRLKPLIENTRQQLGESRYGEHFEYLYRRAQAYEQRQGKKERT